MSFKELFVSDFPLYCVLPFGKGEFCVTGGGGKSKTGVPNAIEVHTLKEEGDGTFESKCIFQHDLGADVIMNMVSSPIDLCTLAASIGSSCHLLQIKKDGRTSKGNTASIEELSTSGKLLIKSTGSVRTDFGEKESYQKVVCFSHDGSTFLTGGMDGTVRVWKTSNLKELFKLRGHKDEIETMACHPAKQLAVSMCRSGEANVWNFTNGRQLKHFNWGFDRKPKYRFRCCCFSPVSTNGEPALFTVNVPFRWDHRAKRDCYLIKWSPSTWTPVVVSKGGKELLSALAISSSGMRIGIGSTEGSVAMYTSDLKLLLRVPKVHSFSVTSLCFVNGTGQPNKPVSNELLLSVSADRTCCITRAKEKGNSCSWTFTFFFLLPFIFFLLSVFILMTVVI